MAALAAQGQADFMELGPPKFETADHARIIEEGRLGKVCAEELAAAQWRQDIVASLNPDAHFDNCRFKQSLAYVHQRIADAAKHAQGGDREDALEELGRALHGIQDFYSHTNFVELMAAQHASIEDVKALALWEPSVGKDLDSLVEKGLTSGKVWWEPHDDCADSVPPHADMAKDSATTTRGKVAIKNWNMTHYRAARTLAHRATLQYLRDVLARQAFANIRNECGELAFTVSFDVRKE